MSNEIDLYESGGDLSPYSPSQPLAPTQSDWGDLPADYTSDRQVTGGVTFFGVAQPGVTPEQLEQFVGEISGTFISDMARLHHPRKVINAATAWFSANFDQPVRQERKNHNYSLHDHQRDPLANSFANHMQHAGASQEFISNALWWLGELAKRLSGNAQQVPPGARTPTYSSNEPELTDKEWEIVEQQNEYYAARVQDTLRQKWGSSFSQNLQAAQTWLDNLPARERDALDKWTNVNGQLIHSFNTLEVLEFSFASSVGAGNLPTGAALATEITEIESFMRSNSKAYFSDIRLQSRLRELYRLRDG